MTKTTGATAARGFRGAELGWPELHRIPHPPFRVPVIGDVVGARLRSGSVSWTGPRAGTA